MAPYEVVECVRCKRCAVSSSFDAARGILLWAERGLVGMKDEPVASPIVSGNLFSDAEDRFDAGGDVIWGA